MRPMRRVRLVVLVVAISVAAVASTEAQDPSAADLTARPNPSEQQRLAADDLTKVADTAEREMRIERARRMAPIDLWFGVR